MSVLSQTSAPPASASSPAVRSVLVGILLAISLSHLLNDAIQAVLPAIYPLLKKSYALDYVQVGFITFTFQMTASILQPFVGHYTDRRPLPYSLAIGMGGTLVGIVLLAFAHSLAGILVAAAAIGLGSAVFHPEASRVARMASGGRHGTAQSLFQVGGNAGTSFGPLLAAGIVLPHGQVSVLWFCVLALAAILILSFIGRWYRARLATQQSRSRAETAAVSRYTPRQVWQAIAVLLALIFSKYFYLECFKSYYTFYLIHHFGVSDQHADIFLFLFLFAVAVGTIVGGPVGDRIGRKRVIWASILGVAPFSLILPHVGLFWTATLTVLIGLILASAFSAILVYAQELIPGKVGLISGLFFGFAFGMAGIGSAVLGKLADRTSIELVYQVCAYLPLLGLLAGLLPREPAEPIAVPA